MDWRRVYGSVLVYLNCTVHLIAWKEKLEHLKSEEQFGIPLLDSHLFLAYRSTFQRDQPDYNLVALWRFEFRCYTSTCSWKTVNWWSGTEVCIFPLNQQKKLEVKLNMQSFKLSLLNPWNPVSHLKNVRCMTQELKIWPAEALIFRAIK